MSFRELRNIAEMLRALGFPRQVSVENFRSPNFPLVSEILAWLIRRFDPSADLPVDVDTEQDRVIFIRSIAQFMASKSNVRLNTKRLYQADGYAVQEILKALTLLYTALLNNNQQVNDVDEGETTLNFDVSNKIVELKHIRTLASEITSRGATLYDLLRREVDLREKRTSIINRQLELTEVESGITQAIKSAEDEAKKNQSAIENVGADEQTIEAKIEKKKTGLERGEKRLLTLKKVRPAFMDEYEKLEADLKKQYEMFVQRFISLSFLEQQLDDYDKQEQEKMSEREIATRKLLEKLRSEENGMALDDSSDDEDEDDDDDDDDDDEDEEEDELLKDLAGDKTDREKQARKSAKALASQVPGFRKPPPIATLKPGKGGRRQQFGNMAGDLDSDGSLDSDTDFNLDGGADGEDSDLDGAGSDLDLRGGAAMVGGAHKAKRGMRAAAAPTPDDDDDF